MADSDSPAEARKSDGGSPRLARSAGVFGLATITSRILGLGRDQVIAYYFGAGDANDAFRVASRIPNLVRDLFAEGAMSAAFVPTFTRQLTLQGRERSWRLASSVINALLLVTGAIVVLGIVFAEPLVRLFASEFADVPGKIELTIYLTRIVFPFLTLVAVAAVLMGMLNSLGHFFIPALSPAMFNVAVIVISLAFIPFSERLGIQPITIVAIATLAGGIGQLVIQWPPLRKEGFRYRPVLDLRDEGMHRVLLLMGPGTIGMAATQINVSVNTVLATGEGTGAVSWLDFAFRLMYLPIGLFGVSIATAATPAISRMVAEQDFARIRSTLANALGLMLFLNLPATIGLIVLARPIVAVIFEHGEFTASDTVATAAALQLYAIGLIGYSVVRIISPTFYAIGRSRVPVMVSAGSVIVNIILNVTLVQYLGYRGLALGTSITAIVNASVQLFLLRREIHGIEGRRIATSFGRVIVASAAMGAVTWGAFVAMLELLPGDSLALQMVRLLVTIGVSLAALAAMAQAVRIQEFAEARDLIVGRLEKDGRLKDRGWLGLHTSIWKVASTHVVVDAYTNIYAPMLPLLILRHDLSLTTAGTLAMCFQMANSVSQFGFGALADRWRPRVLVIAGPLVAVTVLSLIGLAVSPLTLGLILVLGGLGGAAFHPPAAALVYKLADHRKGLAMSTHLSGGSLGFAAAPVLFAPFVASIGLQWSPIIMIPGLLALSWTLRQVPEMSQPHAHERSTLKSLRPAAVPLTLLYFTIVLRTATTYGFMVFTPTLLTQQGYSIAEASTAVSLYLFASGIGGFLGGPLADRIGARNVILWSLIASVPFMAVAPHLAPLGFTAMLAIGGLLLQSTLPISVTFAQTFTKGGAATVSSLMMGFAWGMGSLTVPLVGMGADRFGIRETLAVVAFIPLLAAVLAWRLPERGTHHVEPKVDALP